MYDLMSMKSIAKELNNRTFTDYYYRLMLLARSVFEWKGLPNGIDEKWIERYLFNEGRCMFFKDDKLGFMVTKCADGGLLNAYDEPTALTSIATNHAPVTLKNNTECILIRNNDDMIPTSPTIQLYAMKLAEISRTTDINIRAQKTPVIIKCSDKQRMTLKQVFKQWDEFEPVIYGDKNLDVDDMKVLNIQAPIVFDKLQLQKHSIWNECMTFLGINNANMDKRERLVASEVDANDEQIEQSAHVMLKARQKACEQINELFGLNISVKLRCSQNQNGEELEYVEEEGVQYG